MYSYTNPNNYFFTHCVLALMILNKIIYLQLNIRQTFVLFDRNLQHYVMCRLINAIRWHFVENYEIIFFPLPWNFIENYL